MVATMFLPLTLVTGFFGQNFGFLVDELISTPQAFWIWCVGFETLVAVVAIVLVRRVSAGKRACCSAQRSFARGVSGEKALATHSICEPRSDRRMTERLTKAKSLGWLKIRTFCPSCWIT
ncbi:CorA family divalent cation transporter [Deinococcus oregonensis]|uniref:CorA family divalent cation transporter n=1 Tax=Deinococcus oregonensis TaxID=1805970 RepID=A0ABV6B4M0_9DEIO